MGEPIRDADDIREHGMQVGLVCTHWAYIEWLFEVTHWWLIGLLNKQHEGRIITGGLTLETLAKRVCSLSHLRISDPTDQNILEQIKNRIIAVKDERNLAVHGVRAVQPDNSITGVVARGKYKGEPQQISLDRLRSLNAELASIIDVLEPILKRLGVIEGTMSDLRRQQSSQTEQ